MLYPEYFTAKQARELTEYGNSVEKQISDICASIKEQAISSSSLRKILFSVDLSSNKYLDTPEFKQSLIIRKVLERLGYRIDVTFIPMVIPDKNLQWFAFDISW